jgi:2,4-dienoyl-CoA reductase-like NADH-dependent reductase (Old Yellow Enzyme family)
MYSSLFEPIQLAGVTVPNRIVRAAHGIEMDEESTLAYHEARAKGGVGLTMLGLIVTKDGDGSPHARDEGLQAADGFWF